MKHSLSLPFDLCTRFFQLLFHDIIVENDYFWNCSNGVSEVINLGEKTILDDYLFIMIDCSFI